MKITIKTKAVLTAVLIVLSLFSIKSSADDFHFITYVTGDSIGDEFFYIANGHGDVNGDGYEDVLIGAPDGAVFGYVKMFFGSADFDTIPDLIIHGEPQAFESDFGSGVAIIGDVNIDGYDDLIISDPAHCRLGMHTGKAYLYFGSQEVDTIPDLVFNGQDLESLLGAVSGAGDVNNDGYDDWLITEPTLGWSPMMHLYYGSSEPDSIWDVNFEFPIGVLPKFNNPALGDINGDGFDDILISLYGGEISAEIYFGSDSMDTDADLIFYGEPPVRYTPPISGVGDVNDDGYNDWWMRGSAGDWLFFGSAHPDTIPDMLFEPEAPIYGFKDKVNGGDIDGDNISDIIIGGYIGVTAGGHGQVLGFIGGTEIDNQYDYFFDSGIEFEWLGHTIGVADINNDSIMELISGAQQYHSQEYWGPGRVWFLSTYEWNSVNGEIDVSPDKIDLFKCFPNPFNAVTTISFDIPEAGKVLLKVYNIQGIEVAKLFDGFRPAGSYNLTFDGSDLSSGIYLARFETGKHSTTQKLLLIK